MEKELYQNLSHATQYCQIAEEFCNDIETRQEEIQSIKLNFNCKKEEKEKPFLRLRMVSLFIFVPCAILLGLILIVALCGDVEVTEEDIGTLMFFIPVSLLSLALFIFSKIRLKKIAVKFEDIKRHILADIDEIEKSISEIAETGEKFVETNRHLIEFLPGQYRNLQASAYMLMAVKNGRADTLKEAINLYEEQLHRWKMEDAARQSAEAQEYLAMAIDELSSQQAETNDHLRSIEFMQYMQYLNNRSND